MVPGTDIIILARTDARAALGVDEAIERCKKFVEIGADITFFGERSTSLDRTVLSCDGI